MSWLVAIVLALCVPFGQLRTNSDRITCCCPDPSHCKCPDHKADHSGQPKLRACHKVAHEGIIVQHPTFVAPMAVAVIAPDAVAPLPSISLAHPHEAPAPGRPDAPS